MTNQQDSTEERSTPERQRRLDAFAQAALTGLLNGDPNMPSRIATRHAWATAKLMLDGEPE